MTLPKKLPEWNKTALWMRVSTEEQTTANQQEILLRKAHELGLNVVKIYDTTFSVYKNSVEPYVNQVIEDSRRYRFNHVIFYDLSRLTRGGGLVRIWDIVNKFHRNGIQLHSCDPGEQNLDLDNIESELIISMKDIFNRESSRVKSRRTIAGMNRSRAEGKHQGRPKGSKDKKRRKTAGYHGNFNGVRNKKTWQGEIPI